MEALYRWELGAFRAVNLGWRSPFADLAFLVLSYAGLGQVQAFFAILCWWVPAARRYTFPVLSTVLINGLLFAQGLKRLFIDRERPSHLIDSVVQEGHFSKSFPSGHATTAFAVATMIFLMTARSRRVWVGWMAMVWAAGVALSRMYRGVHWPTDVIGGACAGMVGSALLFMVLQRIGWLDLDDLPWRRPSPEGSTEGAPLRTD